MSSPFGLEPNLLTSTNPCGWYEEGPSGTGLRLKDVYHMGRRDGSKDSGPEFGGGDTTPVTFVFANCHIIKKGETCWIRHTKSRSDSSGKVRSYEKLEIEIYIYWFPYHFSKNVIFVSEPPRRGLETTVQRFSSSRILKKHIPGESSDHFRYLSFFRRIHVFYFTSSNFSYGQKFSMSTVVFFLC